ncbi:19405_t:CDS:2 [Cetraspora pellucida]|uniref:19405_t:CDS:1 n=1 Tax=Cetraspora pellucida TaxID=1433469 RepID=A0A9N9FA53_9GLOM|nr:19405_t:CDS:2 [Cetraspora pellucida]
MQSHTVLPPIKFLLSPTNDAHGPLSSPSPVRSAVQLPSLPSYDRHAGSIRTLLSPPESPEIASTYGSRQLQHHEERYIVPQTSEQQCACCVGRPVSIYQSSYNQQSSPSVYESSYSQQRYSSCPPLIHPIPISPFSRKPTLSAMQSLPRLNTSLLTPATKHYGYHTDHFNGQISPNDSSSGNRYQCPYCSKRFSRPSSLRIHTYSHTGEKPFVCTEPGCGRKFSVQSNMRRHLRVHRLGRTVKKTRYEGEIEGVKMLSHHAAIFRGY